MLLYAERGFDVWYRYWCIAAAAAEPKVIEAWVRSLVRTQHGYISIPNNLLIKRGGGAMTAVLIGYYPFITAKLTHSNFK